MPHIGGRCDSTHGNIKIKINCDDNLKQCIAQYVRISAVPSPISNTSRVDSHTSHTTRPVRQSHSSR